MTDIRSGNFEHLPFEDESIAVALSSLIFAYAEESRYMLGGVDASPYRIKPSTFRLEELAREIERVLIPGGVYMPFEHKVEQYFSPEDWKKFEMRLPRMNVGSPSRIKIFQKPSV